MNTSPEVGEVVVMPFMGDDDVSIIVSKVPLNQPLLDLEDLYVIVDQYGETHIAERGPDGLSVVNPHELAPLGYDAWEEYLTQEGQVKPKKP